MSADHDAAEFRQTIEAFYTAILDNDAASLERLTAPDLTYGHSTGVVETREQFIANVLVPNRKSLCGDNQTNLIHGDTAISRHKMRGERERDGVAKLTDIDVMMVWHKQDGAWRLLARQAFRV